MATKKGYGDNMFIYVGRAYRRHGRRCRIYRPTADSAWVIAWFRDGFKGAVRRSKLKPAGGSK